MRGSRGAGCERVAQQREEIRALQRAVEGRGGVPEEIVCPITHEIMLDPVVAADAHTYERKAIETWLQQKKTSPMVSAAGDGCALNTSPPYTLSIPCNPHILFRRTNLWRTLA